MAEQNLTLQPGDTLNLRSSDGSALIVNSNPYHPDTCSISAQASFHPPEPEPQGACSIAVFQPASGQIAIRRSVSAGSAEEIRPAPDPHGTQVVIGSEIWSFRDGIWTAPSGEQTQFGQSGDIPMGGRFGNKFGKCIGRDDDRTVEGRMTQGRVFKFPPADGAPEEWIGSDDWEYSFSHPWGNAPGVWWLGNAYPYGGWLRSYKHGSEKRFTWDYQTGDHVLGALFDGQNPGLALFHQGLWKVWFNFNTFVHNSAAPPADLQFVYGGPGDVPLAGQLQ